MLHFNQKCRNNWHIHKSESSGGQILICVDGEGWYQEEGKTPRKLHIDDVIYLLMLNIGMEQLLVAGLVTLL